LASLFVAHHIAKDPTKLDLGPLIIQKGGGRQRKKEGGIEADEGGDAPMKASNGKLVGNMMVN